MMCSYSRIGILDQRFWLFIGAISTAGVNGRPLRWKNVVKQLVSGVGILRLTDSNFAAVKEWEKINNLHFKFQFYFRSKKQNSVILNVPERLLSLFYRFQKHTKTNTGYNLVLFSAHSVFEYRNEFLRSKILSVWQEMCRMVTLSTSQHTLQLLAKNTNYSCLHFTRPRTQFFLYFCFSLFCTFIMIYFTIFLFIFIHSVCLLFPPLKISLHRRSPPLPGGQLGCGEQSSNPPHGSPPL